MTDKYCPIRADKCYGEECKFWYKGAEHECALKLFLWDKANKAISNMLEMSIERARFECEEYEENRTMKEQKEEFAKRQMRTYDKDKYSELIGKDKYAGKYKDEGKEDKIDKDYAAREEND